MKNLWRFGCVLCLCSLSIVSIAGCGGGATDSSVIAPPADEAAQRAAEEAYDKEVAEANQ